MQIVFEHYNLLICPVVVTVNGSKNVDVTPVTFASTDFVLQTTVVRVLVLHR